MMTDKFAQYFLPIVCVVLMVIVCVLGGAGFGWNYGVASEQRKVKEERENMAQREKDIAAAEKKWERDVAVESAKFGSAALQLEAARATISQLEDYTRVEIKTVASPVRQCLSPATARVLNAAIAKANARLAKAADPGRAVATVSSPTVIPIAVPDPAAIGLPEGLSEAETAELINAAVSNYLKAAEQHNALTARLRSSPLIEVIPLNRSL